MTIRRTLLLLVLALLLPTGARAAEKLTLLFAPTTGLMPSYIAKDEGMFAKHGLDVDLVLLTNQGAVISALVGGSAQIVTPSALAVIQASDQGIDVVFIASSSMSPSKSRSGIFAKNGSGINTAQDLIGKKVGVPSLYTLIHVIARRWLELNGVDYNKVNFAEIGFQQMYDALNGGIVDGVSAIDPYYGKLEQVGHIVGNPDASLPPNTLTSVYAATRGWAESHKDTVAAFRQSLAEAIDFINTHDSEARASLVKYTKQPAAVVADTPMPELQVTVHPEQVQFFIDLARHQGLIKSSPDAAHMIAP
ncbi:MAG TPA: ABC transporter substrate-binding protein [Stellaceae bacterium]|jgi:NitT/TauT family transport system substrate-binding protein|nr:ABC transporter substrate-binding protein [Stellaceae bacterium]